MARLILYPYTPGSYLSASTVEYNEDSGPEHSVIKSMTQLASTVSIYLQFEKFIQCL